MFRITAAYVLIAASVLVFVIVSREGVVKLELGSKEEGVSILGTRSRYSHKRNVNPTIFAQRRRMLGGGAVEKRLRIELMTVAQDLQKVSHHVDWEKLRDEYLMTIYSEKPSSRRQLKSRAPRIRHNGQRKRDWNVAAIEEHLEKVASQAIAEARGYGAPDASSSRPPKVNGTNSEPNQKPDESEGQDSTVMTAPRPSSIAPGDGGDSASDGVGSPTSVGSSTELHTLTSGAVKDAKQAGKTSGRQGDDASFNGKPIPVYVPSKGNCPGAGDVAVSPIPCAPDNLNQICNKYDDAGSFKLCFEACKPSFCCIHDAPPASNDIAPNCNTDVNCAQYGICYIAWWKLHDTIGPATQLRLEQNDDFFDVESSTINEDQTNSQFYREMLFHHFDNSSEIVRLGTVQVNATYALFSSDLIFLNSTYWNTTI